MRYCLSCRYISAGGPICNRCGKSFGGRLCDGKKRHLNPHDAVYCSECGSTNLTDAANYVALGCPLMLLVIAGGIVFLALGGGTLLGWGGQGFTALTGYKSPLVWLIEKSASVLIILFVLYFLSGLIPGEAGRMFRGLLAKLCTESFRLLFLILEKSVVAVFRMLGGNPTRR